MVEEQTFLDNSVSFNSLFTSSSNGTFKYRPFLEHEPPEYLRRFISCENRGNFCRLPREKMSDPRNQQVD